MSVLRKKSNRKTCTDNSIGDVTIDDCANSLRTHVRLKKATNNISSEVTQEATGNEEEWRKIVIDPKKTNFKENSKGTMLSRGKHKEVTSEPENEEGVDYPLDLWFIISEYISPTMVGKFARICKSSYHVTRTATFWFHLYKTYYRSTPGLPERLQPHCMVRVHGLRACVIRMLHYTYYPMIRNPNSLLRVQETPYSLVKRKCCLMWHKVRKNNEKFRWYFYFKLKAMPTKNQMKEKRTFTDRKTDFLEMLDEVAINPEKDCKLLRVECSRYSMLPQVIGLVLQSVTMSLMPGFKDNQLKLGFGTSHVPSTLTNQVVLNEVVNCEIINWWQPSYPHEDNAVTTIELPQNDFWDQNAM